MEYTSNRILYSDETISSNRAAFTLFPEKEHTAEAIFGAVSEIRNNPDMASWQLATEYDRDQLYITMIFRNALIRLFSRYEINVPAELIPKKGTKELRQSSIYKNMYLISGKGPGMSKWQSTVRN